MKVEFQNLQKLHLPILEQLKTASAQVIESGLYLNGPPLKQFEQTFASFVGSDHFIGVGSGLDALEILLLANGIGQGDEVIVPAHTFVATWLAVLKVGAVPVPVDVCDTTYNIAPPKVTKAISAKTKAIIAVHLYGLPCKMLELSQIAKANNLLLLEDAAQSHGATYQNKKTGNLADGAAWSFYPAKNLGAIADAGGITINNESVATKARALRNYGFNRPYDAESLAFNSRLDNLQAAILTIKLEQLERWNDRRKSFAKIYFGKLSKVNAITLPTNSNLDDQAWHQFVIQTDKRDALQNYLDSQGIHTQIHYPVACHQQSATLGSKLDFMNKAKAEDLCKQLLSLPISPEHTESEIDYVASKILAYFSH